MFEYKGKKNDVTPIHERVVEIRLSCSFSWGTTTDTLISEEVNQQKQSKSALWVRKKLMPDASGARVKKLQGVLNEFYAWHCLNTMSTQTKGVRLLPSAFYMLYCERFGDAKQAAEAAFDDLLTHYDADVQLAKQALQAAFKPEDYPPATEIRRYMNMDVKFFPLPTGDRILNVLGQEVANDVDAYVVDMAKAATDDAKAKLKEVIGRMAERLSDPKNIFRDSLTENVDDLLGVLPMMNLANDPAFDAIIREAKATLQGHDPDTLRKNKQVRSQVAKVANDILSRL